MTGKELYWFEVELRREQHFTRTIHLQATDRDAASRAADEMLASGEVSFKDQEVEFANETVHKVLRLDRKPTMKEQLRKKFIKVLKSDKLHLLLLQMQEAIRQVYSHPEVKFDPQVHVARLIVQTGRKKEDGSAEAKVTPVIGIAAALLCKVQQISYDDMSNWSYMELGENLKPRLADYEVLQLESALEAINGPQDGISQIRPLLQIYGHNPDILVQKGKALMGYTFPRLVCDSLDDLKMFTAQLNVLVTLIRSIENE